MNTSSPSPLHVALVDDDPDVRVAMEALLRSLGYRVSLFGDARRLLARGVAGIDCVVSDVQMPGMSGLDLLACLRATPSAPPCILLTAFPDAQVEAQALREGAWCFLSKPVDDDRLSACLERACSTASVRPA
jgi:FixJ family two-component response regulator